MKSLATLIKLQKSRVDEQRLLMVKLQEQLARIEGDLAALRREREEQKELVSAYPELGLTYGEYVRESLKKEALLERKRRTAAQAVSIAHDRLSELFEEQKRYELAEANRLEEEAREEAHKETLALDEVGSISFVRKKGRKDRKQEGRR